MFIHSFIFLHASSLIKHRQNFTFDRYGVPNSAGVDSSCVSLVLSQSGDNLSSVKQLKLQADC